MATQQESLARIGLSPARLQHLQRSIPALHHWYRQTERDLPWRRAKDPYAIWVSEVMLQQTRVSTVVPYFERWMAVFPSIAALAAASVEDVLRTWEGLGYYSRARNLHRAAQIVHTRFAGQVPIDPEAFRLLPGVGTYTVAAVMSIAFDQDLAVVDGNVRRVLCRLLAFEKDPRRAPYAKDLDHLAQILLPTGTAATHNQAMMELGATVCLPRSPTCAECPLRESCLGHKQGNPTDYPLRPRRAEPPHYDVAIGIVFNGDEVFIDRRPYSGLLGGLWEFPGGKIEPGETSEEAVHRELAEEFGLRVRTLIKLPQVRHAYSHFRVTLHPWVCIFQSMESRAAEGNEWKWVSASALEEHPMPRANRLVLEHLHEWKERTGGEHLALPFLPQVARSRTK